MNHTGPYQRQKIRSNGYRQDVCSRSHRIDNSYVYKGGCLLAENRFSVPFDLDTAIQDPRQSAAFIRFSECSVYLFIALYPHLFCRVLQLAVLASRNRCATLQISHHSSPRLVPIWTKAMRFKKSSYQFSKGDGRHIVVSRKRVLAVILLQKFASPKAVQKHLVYF